MRRVGCWTDKLLLHTSAAASAAWPPARKQYWRGLVAQLHMHVCNCAVTVVVQACRLKGVGFPHKSNVHDVSSHISKLQQKYRTAEGWWEVERVELSQV
jgi:hypothetical protein